MEFIDEFIRIMKDVCVDAELLNDVEWEHQ